MRWPKAAGREGPSGRVPGRGTRPGDGGPRRVDGRRPGPAPRRCPVRRVGPCPRPRPRRRRVRGRGRGPASAGDPTHTAGHGTPRVPGAHDGGRNRDPLGRAPGLRGPARYAARAPHPRRTGDGTWDALRRTVRPTQPCTVRPTPTTRTGDGDRHALRRTIRPTRPGTVRRAGPAPTTGAGTGTRLGGRPAYAALHGTPRGPRTRGGPGLGTGAGAGAGAGTGTRFGGRSGLRGDVRRVTWRGFETGARPSSRRWAGGCRGRAGPAGAGAARPAPGRAPRPTDRPPGCLWHRPVSPISRRQAGTACRCPAGRARCAGEPTSGRAEGAGAAGPSDDGALIASMCCSGTRRRLVRPLSPFRWAEPARPSCGADAL